MERGHISYIQKLVFFKASFLLWIFTYKNTPKRHERKGDSFYAIERV